MSALADAARLVEFVVWEMRSGDLPPDVKEASQRLAATVERPAHLRGQVIRYTEGPLRIDGFPMSDGDPLDRRRAYPHQTGRVVQDLLERGCRYVLVQDLKE